MRPLLLDLFCGEGGAAVGYHRAGFDVIGVDLEPKPNYPFPMVVADALAPPFDLAVFDAIHASPPCQGYTTMSNRHGSASPRLIKRVRAMLEGSGLPWVIENVTGARQAMRSPLMLHGGQFDLRVYRPRLFESNILLLSPGRAKSPENPVAIYGRREDQRLLWTRADGSELRAASLEEAREAMGMPWASWNGCREAIPPAYAEWVGVQLLEALAVVS